MRAGKDPYHLRDILQYSKRGEGIELSSILGRDICHLHTQRVIPIAFYNARSPAEGISLSLHEAHEALQVATQASRLEEGEREDMNDERRGASHG